MRSPGLVALDARRARIASALIKRGYNLNQQQAEYAARELIGRGVTVRQAEAVQPNLDARRHIGYAIKIARQVISGAHS